MRAKRGGSDGLSAAFVHLVRLAEDAVMGLGLRGKGGDDAGEGGAEGGAAGGAEGAVGLGSGSALGADKPRSSRWPICGMRGGEVEGKWGRRGWGGREVGRRWG